MALYIANGEAGRLARELAAQTSETLTDAVIAALRDRLERTRKPSDEQRSAQALEVARHAKGLIGDRQVVTDDLYDDNGLPT